MLISPLSFIDTFYDETWLTKAHILFYVKSNVASMKLKLIQKNI